MDIGSDGAHCTESVDECRKKFLADLALEGQCAFVDRPARKLADSSSALRWQDFRAVR